MTEEKFNLTSEKTAVRCAECDREVTYYNTFLLPPNVERNVCWVCVKREEKGFNARRGFKRAARHGIIPR